MKQKLPAWAAFAGGVILFAALMAVEHLAVFNLPPLGANAVLKAALAAVSLLLMAASGRRWKEFGFARPVGVRWLRVIAGGAFLGALATLAIMASPAEGMKLMEGATLLQVVLAVWIWSTLTEEIFTRGWVQSWVRDDGERFLGGRLSAPVLTSALVFGAMHLSLLLRGTDGLTVAIIVTTTTLLGLLAGLYREQSGSLMPAIVCHGAFNVGGFVAGVVWVIATRILTP